MDETQHTERSYRPQYSGLSHALLVLVPPAIGWLATWVFVIFGPYHWLVNWLIAGAVWGVSKPVRSVFRSALRDTTYEFRSPEFSWATCVRNHIWQEWDQWRREPLQTSLAYLGVTAAMAIGWPVLVYLGAMISGSLDHG